MIDTIKMYAIIPDSYYDIVMNFTDINTKYSIKTGELYYQITTDSLEGSYDTRLSVKVSDNACKYKLNGCLIEVEGSFHKLCLGHNCFSGFTDVQYVFNKLIEILSDNYGVDFSLCTWYLQRIDVAICYDLLSNDNVCLYINNLSKLSYPRRRIRFYENESVYCSSTSTTLKIYNKYREFLKHDFNRLRKLDFDVFSLCEKISGYVRFECEIHKKKLVDLYNSNFILIKDVKYNDLFNVWSCEFMKLFKFNDDNINIVRNNNDVRERLLHFYKESKALNLFGFYLSIIQLGYSELKSSYSSSTFYRKIKDLKVAGIDISQSVFIDVDYDKKLINFNPFVDLDKIVV